MDRHKQIGPSGDAPTRPDACSEGSGREGCDVGNGQFPKDGTCCVKNCSITGTVYTKLCPMCSIWTSPPNGADLAVAHIIECVLQGYCRRIR